MPASRNTTGYQRRRGVIACDVCRARRTKCDGQRPKCSFCVSQNGVCFYREDPKPPPTRLEREVSDIGKRLDQLTDLVKSQLSHGTGTTLGSSDNQRHHNPFPAAVEAQTELPRGQDISSEFPFMTIKTPSLMELLGLDRNLVVHLINLEKTNQLQAPPLEGGLPMFALQYQHAINALTSFSNHIHILYPILPTKFTDQFLKAISGPNFSASSSSCLSLLVIAIGSLFTTGQNSLDQAYIKAALTMLSTVLLDSSVESVQCLIFFSVFYCCLMKPCQGYDFIMIASFKVQNLLKSHDFTNDSEESVLIRRSYWAVLLIESEIVIQLELAGSGIWELEVPLPAGHEAWSFDSAAASTAALPSSPETTVSTSSTSDEALSYFVAEIAMRRMLQRCTLSVTPDRNNKLIYAPIIATELEHQLDEWYSYLPEPLRFDVPPSECDRAQNEQEHRQVQTDFLRAQYYAYKSSIYWPAAYQGMELGVADEDLLLYCRKFFNSYICFIASAKSAVHTCKPNAWTLYSSVFVISLTAYRASSVPGLRSAVSPDLCRSFQEAAELLAAAAQASPSLAMLERIYRQVYEAAETPSSC